MINANFFNQLLKWWSMILVLLYKTLLNDHLCNLLAWQLVFWLSIFKNVLVRSANPGHVWKMLYSHHVSVIAPVSCPFLLFLQPPIFKLQDNSSFKIIQPSVFKRFYLRTQLIAKTNIFPNLIFQNFKCVWWGKCINLIREYASLSCKRLSCCSFVCLWAYTTCRNTWKDRRRI